MGYSPSIPHPRELRERFQPVEGTSGLLLLGWLASATLAVIIPVSKWSAERSKYHRYYGQYNEYEYQQQQYENQNNGNYNNNYNGNNNRYSQLCSWWDFQCRYRVGRYQQMYGNGDGGQEEGQMRAMLPGWYFFFGGSIDQDDRDGEEGGMGKNEGSMKFVYTMTIIMFLGLTVFGFRTMYAGKDRMGVIAALLIFGTFSLMNLLTTVQGTVETDNRFFENSIYGWFGQWSVLVAFTDFWLCLHCFLFAGALGVMGCLDKRAARSAALVEPATADDAPAASYNLDNGIYKPDGSQVAVAPAVPAQRTNSYYAAP